MKIRTKEGYCLRRRLRVRRKVAGTAERPRLCVRWSNRYIYVQFVDDDAGRTLAAVTTLPAEEGANGKAPRVNAETAREVGRKAAERARAQGIERVVFDRGAFAYGTRMRALADAAREAGLKF